MATKNNGMVSILKYIVCREKYLDELRDYYGEPEGVRDHLRDLAKKYPIFSRFLEKDIDSFANEADRLAEYEYKRYEAWRYEELANREFEEYASKCSHCVWNNAFSCDDLAACSIPGYCPYE